VANSLAGLVPSFDPAESWTIFGSGLPEALRSDLVAALSPKGQGNLKRRSNFRARGRSSGTPQLAAEVTLRFFKFSADEMNHFNESLGCPGATAHNEVF
jgi:hypothetical protein